jgi:hypothetical protein
MTSAAFPAAGTNENGPVVSFAAVALVVALGTRARLSYSRATGTAPVIGADSATAGTTA